MASSQHRRTKFFAFLVIWLTAALAVSVAIRYELLKKVEYTSWDWRLRSVAQSENADPRIKIIMIDQSSLEHYANFEKLYWPWPRSMYNPLLLYLKAAGAKAVAFDILLTENQTVDDDLEFTAVVSDSVPIVSALTVRQTGVEDSEHGADKATLAKALKSKPPYESKFFSNLRIPRYRFAALPFHELIEASPAFGNVGALPDEDEIYRRIFPGVYLDDSPILNLSFSLFHLLHPESTVGDDIKSFVDQHDKYLIRFHGPAGTYKHYSIHAMINSGVQLLNGQVPSVPLDEFKDAFVFIGSNAPGILDLRPVPFSGTYPGVEVHATIFDNLVHKAFFREVPRIIGIIAATIVLCLVSAVAMYGGRFQTPLLIASFLGWFAFCFVVAQAGWWIPMVNPLFGMTFAALASLGFQYEFEGRQHRFIKNAFQYYVTPEVIDKIVSDPSRLSLGGERRELTIFFSDIAGFTSLSEKMEPAQLVQFLNRFLSEMTDIVLNSGGTIDKYEGDAIIAFWNAPLSVPDHQLRGVRAAIDCQRRLFELAADFDREFGVQVKMRVGLNTGHVTVGNFGSSTRFNYTMIGDAANLASRLEGANKVFGSRILVSEATQKGAIEGITWRKLGEIKVVGKDQVVRVYEPLDSLVHATMLGHLETYRAAIEAFEKLDIDTAEELFRRIDGDPVSAVYLARIAKARHDGGLTTHVWNLTEK